VSNVDVDLLHVYQPLLVELGWPVTLLLVVLCLRLLWCRVDRRVVILLPVMWGSFSGMSSILDALSAVRDVAGIHLWTRHDAAIGALGLLGVGAAASAVVGVVAGFGRSFVLNPPHATRVGSLIVTATGVTVAGLGFVLWLVTRDATISERAIELAGRAMQLLIAGTGAATVTAMLWRTQPAKQPLTRWSILEMAGAAASVAMACLFFATRLQPTLALMR
jgi:hypothetical protein